jgi:uncharacterized protein
MKENKDIKVNFEEKANRFAVRLNGKIAYLTYEKKDDKKVAFDHTYVPEDYRHQGIAGELTETAMEWAKKNNLMVIPACSYVRWWIDQNPEYKDMVVQE